MAAVRAVMSVDPEVWKISAYGLALGAVALDWAGAPNAVSLCVLALSVLLAIIGIIMLVLKHRRDKRHAEPVVAAVVSKLNEEDEEDEGDKVSDPWAYQYLLDTGDRPLMTYEQLASDMLTAAEAILRNAYSGDYDRSVHRGPDGVAGLVSTTSDAGDVGSVQFSGGKVVSVRQGRRALRSLLGAGCRYIEMAELDADGARDGMYVMCKEGAGPTPVTLYRAGVLQVPLELGCLGTVGVVR